MKITLEMSKNAYSILKEVYYGNLSKYDGKISITKTTGMTLGSAQILIMIFLAMMTGEEYKRAFNNETNKFLFESIEKDFGDSFLRNALKAAQKHIDYYSTLKKGNLRGLQKIVNEMTKKLE